MIAVGGAQGNSKQMLRRYLGSENMANRDVLGAYCFYGLLR